MLEFAKRLRLEREKTGLSAEEFGILGGVGKASQYNYEKGLRKPDLEYLYNISQLNCDIQYIITGRRLESALTKEESEHLFLYRSAEASLKKVSTEVLKIDLSDKP